MYDYIKKLIDLLPHDMRGSKYTAAPDFFQTDNEEAVKLSTELSDVFHKLTAQVLWGSKNRTADLQLRTYFL